MIRYVVVIRWHQDLVYNAMWSLSLLVELRGWNAELLAHGLGDTQRVLILGWGQATVRCAQQIILAIRHFSQGVLEETNWESINSVVLISRCIRVNPTYLHIHFTYRSRCHAISVEC